MSRRAQGPLGSRTVQASRLQTSKEVQGPTPRASSKKLAGASGAFRAFSKGRNLRGFPLDCKSAAARGQDPQRALLGSHRKYGGVVGGILPEGLDIPFKGKLNVHCIYWPTGVAGGRAVPPDVRKSPERLYTSILHRLLPLIVLPSTGV